MSLQKTPRPKPPSRQQRFSSIEDIIRTLKQDQKKGRDTQRKIRSSKDDLSR